MKQFETNEELIYALIIEDLEGSITPSDKVFLDQWRAAAAENEKTYQDFLNVQLNLDKLYGRDSLDAADSWNALDKKIMLKAQSGQATQKGRGMRLWFSAAAAVLLLLSAAYYFAYSNRYVVVSTADNAAITRIILPDGTELNLNGGTTIKYLKEGFVQHRKLELKKGEVFIHVAPHSASGFSVDLGDVEAEDIGTSFNVVKNDKKVAVVVEEGKVALKHLQLDRSVMLTAGKLGVYDVGTQALAVADNPNMNYKAWLDRKFTFKEVSVGEVAAQLEKAYQVPVRVKDESLSTRKLTASLHYQTLDSALAVISASLQCKVTKEKNMYVLSDH